MSAAKKPEQWFNDAMSPIQDIAGMIKRLDERGAIPDEMREAIYIHAENAIESMPKYIFAASSALAAALAGDVGIDTPQAAHAAWAITGMADSLMGMHELAFHFEPKNAAFKESALKRPGAAQAQGGAA